ncbi:sugar phosphate isomerase/epimerase [Aureimonas endophytica]|nr:sugar phosphate isomerase/epimerase [Aureimonas endophytica]
MQSMIVLQSLWSMERRHPDGFEPPLEESVERIARAGFDGLSAHWYDDAAVRPIVDAMRQSGITAVEGMCFPTSVESLKPALETASLFPVHHLNIQPDVRPRRLNEAVGLVEGWMRLAEEVDFPVYIETHRGRLTNDLLFTLDLLDEIPDMPLLADLSHYLVGREIELPVSDENQAMIERILEHSWAFHGRVGTCEQVQIEISFPHHAPWIELFRGWWDYGFRSWRRRAETGDIMSFTCELGPRPYAITNRDGEDTTERWAESMQMRDIALDIWARTEQPGSS